MMSEKAQRSGEYRQRKQGNRRETEQNRRREGREREREQTNRERKKKRTRRETGIAANTPSPKNNWPHTNLKLHRHDRRSYYTTYGGGGVLVGGGVLTVFEVMDHVIDTAIR